jgi:hypothetical protein
MRISRRTGLALALASLGWASPALAHRPQSVLTTLEWNPQARMLEAIHRIHGHDAEVALSFLIADRAGQDLSTPKGQAHLALYVERRFSVRVDDDALTFATIGAELAGEDIVLYQEARLAAAPEALEVDNRILRDVFEAQTNLVNVRMDKRTRTLIFSGRDGPKRARGLL